MILIAGPFFAFLIFLCMFKPIRFVIGWITFILFLILLIAGLYSFSHLPS